MDKQKLEPCQLCDSEDVSVKSYIGTSGDFFELVEAERFCVCCSACGANGADSDSVNVTVSKWNTRPKEDKLNARIRELEEVVSEFSRLVKNKSIIHNKEKYEDINRITDLLIPLLNKGNKND